MYMKKFVLAVLILLAMVTFAQAADVFVNSKIESITVARDKNGNEYTRAIILEDKTLNGVKYSTGTAVMGFGAMSSQLKKLKAGDTLKAVCSSNEYKGRTSYVIQGFAK